MRGSKGSLFSHLAARPIKVAVRRSALAVLRLTSVSNLVGSWTGKSAGFVALRTRLMS